MYLNRSQVINAATRRSYFVDVIMNGHNLYSLVEARSPNKVHFLSLLPFVPYSTCPITRSLHRNTSSPDFILPS